MNIYRSDSLKSNESMNAENDIDYLKAEYENEKNYRDNALWRNKETEKAIVKLQDKLRKDDYEWEYDDDLNSVIIKNQLLNEEIKNLKIQLPELKEKLKNAKPCGKECKMKHDNLNINLDILSELELIRTAKRLERMKTDIRSALISREWSLDNESKVYQKVLDQKNHLQNQLYRLNTGGMRDGYYDRWQTGGNKTSRSSDLKNGPVKQTIILPPVKVFRSIKIH